MTPTEARALAQQYVTELTEKVSRLPGFSAGIISVVVEDAETFAGVSVITGAPKALTHCLAAALHNIEREPENGGVVNAAFEVMHKGAVLTEGVLDVPLLSTEELQQRNAENYYGGDRVFGRFGDGEEDEG
jgi:hypothetical protein